MEPMAIGGSPQPRPGALEYELAGDTRAAVLTAWPGAGAGAAAGAGAGAAAAAPQAPLAGYRLPTSAPTIVRLHDPRAPFRYPRITALLNHIHCHSVSYTHPRAHETVLDLVCRLLLEKKKRFTYLIYTSPIPLHMHKPHRPYSSLQQHQHPYPNIEPHNTNTHTTTTKSDST